jgi:NAD-dependent deacetylase
MAASAANFSDACGKAAAVLRSAQRVTVFTGAGISVESGIPPFRGNGGLWTKFDPEFLEIHFFQAHPKESWRVLREIFYNTFAEAEPNDAHRILAELEQRGLVQCVITQNIDSLHQRAGSKIVWEFHGSCRTLICLNCTKHYPVAEVGLEELPPTCRICGGLLKPDIVFFGEPIPEPANSKSFLEATLSDVFLVIGSSGEIMPACMIPPTAQANGATIIEINPEPSRFTDEITDVFLQANATQGMKTLRAALALD